MPKSKPYFVVAHYKKGINEHMDKLAFFHADKHGGQFVGSGCYIDEEAMRDLEFEVKTEAKAKALALAFKKAGFIHVKSGQYVVAETK